MKFKTLARPLVALMVASFSAAARGDAKPYDNWPSTDPEWNALTNHIMWCYESLRQRTQIADASSLGSSNYGGPVLICPFSDYVEIAQVIDWIAPRFVNQSLSGPNGHFDDWFSSTNNSLGRCPDDFPHWTPASLHSNAFGRADWSTNSTLSAWMAVTNRAFVSEVTSTLYTLNRRLTKSH